MTLVLSFLLGVPLAYLWGSIPWGLWVGRWLKGVDVRDYGSGAIGMANVLRTLGVGAGLLVLFLDLGKGVVAGLVPWAVGLWLGLGGAGTASLRTACALSTLLGHVFPVLAGFRGGRGVATGLGALLVLSPPAGGVALLLGLPALFLSRFVSVGSLVGAVSGGLAALALGLAGVHPLAIGLYGVLGAGLIVWMHRGNIRRLLRGEEHRLGQPARPLRRSLAGGREEG